MTRSTARNRTFINQRTVWCAEPKLGEELGERPNHAESRRRREEEEERRRQRRRPILKTPPQASTRAVLRAPLDAHYNRWALGHALGGVPTRERQWAAEKP